jgi:hypothetical protein
MSSTPLDNQRHRREQSSSGLPLALIIHEGRDEDTFLASVTRQGETLIFELDDGRSIEVDRRELLDRAA